jgi:hypothetical protein
MNTVIFFIGSFFINENFGGSPFLQTFDLENDLFEVMHGYQWAEVKDTDSFRSQLSFLTNDDYAAIYGN